MSARMYFGSPPAVRIVETPHSLPQKYLQREIRHKPCWQEPTERMHMGLQQRRIVDVSDAVPPPRVLDEIVQEEGDFAQWELDKLRNNMHCCTQPAYSYSPSWNDCFDLKPQGSKRATAKSSSRKTSFTEILLRKIEWRLRIRRMIIIMGVYGGYLN